MNKKGRKQQNPLEPLPEIQTLQQVLDGIKFRTATHLGEQPVCIKGQMRWYQLDGLNWLIWLYENGIHGILADEMGLGKTLQALSLLVYLKQYLGQKGPHLVVAPKSTLPNWMKEVRTFCDDFKAVQFHGDKIKRKEIAENELQQGTFDLCVTSYEMASKYGKSILKKFNWDYIIVDEAHRIKNDQSLLSKILRTFKSRHRLLLTGTPLQNNLHELWALLNFLVPDVFKDSNKFDNLFESKKEEEKDQDEDEDNQMQIDINEEQEEEQEKEEDEEQQKKLEEIIKIDPNDSMHKEKEQEFVSQLHRMLRPFILRRLKLDVETLPSKHEILVFVKLTEMQRAWYKSLFYKDLDAINGLGANRFRLLNIAMQ
ncbi:MAG: putative ISWI chromatin-remodeling complex ATPase CHR17, partial [Streblomastix strix]